MTSMWIVLPTEPVWCDTSLVVSSSPYFIFLILASQLTACIDYTAILPYYGLPDHVFSIVSHILYYLPLALLLLLHGER